MSSPRFWLIRLLGVRECGAFGGMIQNYGETVHKQRWCLKPFGHGDSCAYEVLPDQPGSQPGFALRARGRGREP